MTSGEVAVINEMGTLLKAGRLDQPALEKTLADFVKIVGRIPGRAVFFNDTRARIFLHNNEIFGHVSLFGPTAGNKVDSALLAALARNAIGVLLHSPVKFVPNNASLLLVENTLTSLGIGDEMFRLLQDVLEGKSEVLPPVYEDAMLKGNTFEYLENILLAANTNFQGNAFRQPESGLALLSVGETGIYVGNRGTHPDTLLAAANRERQEVANLRLVVL